MKSTRFKRVFAKGGTVSPTAVVNRPMPYDYVPASGRTNYGTVTRQDYNDLVTTGKVPLNRRNLSDAAWQNVLNEFKSNPLIQGISVSNIRLPYGTGDQIVGKQYPIDLPNLQGRGVSDQSSQFTPEVKPLAISKRTQAKSRKVNAYNYSKGRPYNTVENIFRKKPESKYNLGGILEAAAPYVLSAANTVFNVGQTNKLRTDRRPIYAKYTPTQYKSNLGEITDINRGSYQGFIDDPNMNVNQKNVAFANMLGANTQAGLADQSEFNRFNLANSEMQARINMQNTQMANAVAEGNLDRYNNKIIAQTQAVNAGVQDLINIDAQRKLGNVQQKEMLLKLLESGETGVIQRAASEFGYDNVEDFIEALNNPNAALRKRVKINGRRNKYRQDNVDLVPLEQTIT